MSLARNDSSPEFPQADSTHTSIVGTSLTVVLPPSHTVALTCSQVYLMRTCSYIQ